MDELFKRLKYGDEEAFEYLVKLYERQLLIIAKIRLNDEHLAKDAVQETFLSLFLNSAKISNSNKIKQWFTAVLVNKCNDLVRENKIIQVSFEQNDFENFIYSDDEFKNIIDKIDFISKINLLDIEERTIIAMYYEGDYTTKEISEILNISIGTIKSKISRAKIKLKNKIGGN